MDCFRFIHSPVNRPGMLRWFSTTLASKYYSAWTFYNLWKFHARHHSILLWRKIQQHIRCVCYSTNNNNICFSNFPPFLQSKEVLIAAGICTVVCLSITLFSLQTKWDFTVCGGFIFVSFVVLLMFAIMAICMPSYVMNLLYASLGALVFSLYLVFDTQLMLGGSHKYSISPEEYIFAALNLYLDIVNIFIYILAIVGGSNR